MKKKNCYYLRRRVFGDFINSLPDMFSNADDIAGIKEGLEVQDLIFFKSVRNHITFMNLPTAVSDKYKVTPVAFTVKLSEIARFGSMLPSDYTNRKMAQAIIESKEYVLVDWEGNMLSKNQILDLLEYDKVKIEAIGSVQTA